MKQKQQVIVLVVLVVAAAVIWSFEWRTQTPSMQTASLIHDYRVLAVENPQIRWGELKRAQETEYKSNGRNPFSMIAAPTAEQVRQKRAAEDVQNLPPPTLPTPPKPTRASLPANLKYFGYGTVPNGTPRRAFFTDGEDVYVVTEGDTLLGRYRILKVGNSNLEFLEISIGLPGTAPLEVADGPG